MRRNIIKLLLYPCSLLLLWLLPIAQASPAQVQVAEQQQEQQADRPGELAALVDSLLWSSLPQNRRLQDSLSQNHLPRRLEREDAIPYKPRHISKEVLGELKADSNMNYQRASPDDNLWAKFRQWLVIKLLAVFGTPAAVNALEIIIYILILVTLAYTILRLMKVDVQGLFFRKNKRRGVLQQKAEAYENIHEIDFMEAIEEALLAQEYNKAVRLLYLSALKELTDREHINWQAGKTNFQYQQELTDLGLQAPFRELGYFFEWAWYGNLHLNESQYQQARSIYQSLEQQLQQKA